MAIVEMHGTQSFQSGMLASKYCTTLKTVNALHNTLKAYVQCLTTAVLPWKSVPFTAVTPQQANPSPRYYRKFYLQNRGIPAVFVGFPRLPRYYRRPHYRAGL